MENRFSRQRAKELFAKGMKSCSSCKRIKAHKSFYKNKNTWDGFKQLCKVCSRNELAVYQQKAKLDPVKLQKRRDAYLRNRARDNAQNLLTGSRRNAKKFNLEHTISLQDIVIPEVCPVLGIPLFRGLEKAGPNSPSIDRIDNSKGYIPGNICIMSWRANSLKKDSTLTEMERIVKWMKDNPP